ncbi:protein of unknown function [Cupriavidus taiwanensis]|nr:protein of unknown function [Cupriavidus taiwanensis]
MSSTCFARSECKYVALRSAPKFATNWQGPALRARPTLCKTSHRSCPHTRYSRMDPNSSPQNLKRSYFAKEANATHLPLTIDPI